MDMTLKGSVLKEIANKSPTAEITATALAMRERQRHSLDITRYRTELTKKGEKIVETDYMQFWKDLQDAGVGSIVYGRKGKPDRFNWHYSLKSVGQACLEGKDIETKKLVVTKKPKTILRKAPQNVKRSRSNNDSSSGDASIGRGTPTLEKFIYIPLRADFDVEIKLPQNLTKSEVDTLVKAISKSL